MISVQKKLKMMTKKRDNNGMCVQAADDNKEQKKR